MLGPLLYLALSYLVGSVPTGPILATLYAATDLTQAGSGNIGATNVNRLLGRRFAIATLVGDVGKGLLPVLLSHTVLDAPWFAGLVAIAAFCGHCWSAYLCFRGGKGVATAAGGMLAIAPLATLLAATAWMGGLMLFKRSSKAAVVGAVAMIGFVLLVRPSALWIAGVLSMGVLFRHRSNMRTFRGGRSA